MLNLRPILRHRRAILVAYAVILAVAALGLPRLEQDNSPEVFFVRDAPALERYDAFERRFGRDRAVRVVLSGDGIWTPEGLDFLRHVEEEAQKLHGVTGAIGLFRHHQGEVVGWPPEDVAGFRRAVRENLVDHEAGWVSADGEVVTLVAGLYRLPPAKRRTALAELQAILNGAPPGVDTRLLGLPVLSGVLDAALVLMAWRLFPIVTVLAALLLFVLFSRRRDVVLPLAFVATVETTVFGAMGHLGVRLDFVTIVLAPLVFVIALATAVHLLAGFRRELPKHGDPETAVLATFRVKAWPVVATGITTGAGFGSLAASAVPPIRAIGVWAAFGLAFLTLAALTLYPALLASFGGGRARLGAAHAPRMPPGERLGRGLATFAIRRRWWVVGGFVTAALLAVPGLARLDFSSNVLTYLRPEHPVRAATEDLERRGVGVVAAEMVLEIEAGPETAGAISLRDPVGLERLSRLAERLRSDPEVFGVLGAGDLVDERGAPDRLTALAEIAASPDLDRLLGFLQSSKGDAARLTILLPMSDLERLEPLLARAVAKARSVVPEATVTITGRFPLLLAAQRNLFETMVSSIAITFAVVALLFWGFLGSAGLAFRMLVPNVLPVVLVLGGMGWLGLPIDATTVMIASIVLGLAVDDTLHTMGHFLAHVPAGDPSASPSEAIVQALEETAGAHLATSALLMLGFGICGFAELVPIARFGTLSALAIVLVLTADLLVVPALLATVSPAAHRRAARRAGVGSGSR